MPLPSPKTSDHLIRGFTHSLPMALLRARELVMQRFRPVLATHDLTEQQWRILRALHDQDGQEVSGLAQECQILLPSILGILKRLEARGLVMRQTHHTDQRITLITLTPSANRLIQTLLPQIAATYAEIETRLGSKQLEELYGLLYQLEERL
jgi:homoprotocatechuate degradation regulator HpaR